MSRRAPRPLSLALGGLTDALAPATPLARVQQVWERAVGATIAAAGRPTAERDGVLTIACADAVWAAELELMGPSWWPASTALSATNLSTSFAAASPDELSPRSAPRSWGLAGGARPNPSQGPSFGLFAGILSFFAARFGGVAVLLFCKQTHRPGPRSNGPGIRGVLTSSEDHWRPILQARRPRLPQRAASTTPPWAATPATTRRTSPSSRASRRSASAPACTSARPASWACTTSSTRSSTTPSTRRSPASAPRSRSRSTPTTRSRSSTTAAGSPSRSWRRRAGPRSRSCSPSCTPAASSATAAATRSPAACTASASRSSTRSPSACSCEIRRDGYVWSAGVLARRSPGASCQRARSCRRARPPARPSPSSPTPTSSSRSTSTSTRSRSACARRPSSRAA